MTLQMDPTLQFGLLESSFQGGEDTPSPHLQVWPGFVQQETCGGDFSGSSVALCQVSLPGEELVMEMVTGEWAAETPRSAGGGGAGGTTASPTPWGEGD